MLVATLLDNHTQQKIHLFVFLTWFHLLVENTFMSTVTAMNLQGQFCCLCALNSCPGSWKSKHWEAGWLRKHPAPSRENTMQLFHFLSGMYFVSSLCCSGVQTQGERGSLVFKCLYPNSLWCQDPTSSSCIFHVHVWVFYNKGIDGKGTLCSWVYLQLCCRRLKQKTPVEFLIWVSLTS